MASSPNFNALMLQGLQTGREIRREEGERNALAGLVNGEEGALGNLATYNPQAAMQVQQQQQQRAAQVEKERQAQLAAGTKLVGQAALIVSQYPEAQRAQAWDAQIDALAQQGWDGIAQFKGKYSPQALESVIAQSGLASEYASQQRPRYMAIPEGGTLVDTSNPAAVQQFGQQPAPAAQKPTTQIIPQRPPNMDDTALISQAREAIAAGANADEVFRQLQAWGVNP